MVAADDFLDGFAGLAVTRGVLGAIDLAQGVVGIFDEVEKEKGCRVRGGRLKLWMRFEGSVLMSYLSSMSRSSVRSENIMSSVLWGKYRQVATAYEKGEGIFPGSCAP